MKIAMRDVTLIKQFHRAFFAWLDINLYRFLMPTFEFSDENRCVINFTTSGLHRALHFALYSRGLAMWYDWQGVRWIIKRFEAFPVVTEDNSYIDGLSQDKYPPVYPSREALWTACIFEQFLAWVNSELTPPRWLARHPLARPLTDAHFIQNPDTNWRVILPIWTNQDL